ncbi:lactadherin-like, partial [Anneissia japonica]|uniref:lactadherin-like n=1 Tax=Anneissia japonica TaxID=1529436 RepID=UPI001425B948
SCNKPLGLEDGTIPSEKLTASSEYSHGFAAHLARLNDARGWISRNNQQQWIQVEFSSPLWVTGLITQGRGDYPQWVRSYEVHYSLDGDTFTTIMDAGAVAVFNANSDHDTAVTNMFPSRVRAKFIQIHTTICHDRCSLRFEVLGCSHDTILYNHHCYKFVNNATTWNDAKAMCESFSSHLITINTEEELSNITAIASTLDDFPVKIWTGLNDVAEEGHPVWLTHEQPTYNEFRITTDPDNKDCFRIGSGGNIRHESCNDEYGYVCESKNN